MRKDCVMFSQPIACMAVVVLTALLTGCITLESLKVNPLSPEARIARYLQKNPNRPEEIKTALQKASLCKGMTSDEVILCWGKPQVKKANENGEIWDYFETQRGGIGEDHGSSLFDYTVPLGEAVLERSTSGLSLTEWTIYGEVEESATAKPKADETMKPAPKKESAPAAAAIQKPAITPDVDLSQWPSLRVSGLMTRGAKQGAIINDTFIMVGDTVDEVKLLMVTEDGIYVSYSGQTTFIQKIQGEPARKRSSKNK